MIVRSRRCTAYLKASSKSRSGIRRHTVTILSCRCDLVPYMRLVRFWKKDVHRLRGRMQGLSDPDSIYISVNLRPDKHSRFQVTPFHSQEALFGFRGLPGYPGARIHACQHTSLARQGVYQSVFGRSDRDQEGRSGAVSDDCCWTSVASGSKVSCPPAIFI